MGGVIDVSEVERSIAQQRVDEIYRLQERVRQLEKLNATIAADIDRLRPVVEAAIEWKKYSLAESDNDELLEAIGDYEESQPR